jgi:hypothetical protein
MEIDSLSNNTNYSKSKHYSIYFTELVLERERDRPSVKLLLI